MSHTPAYRPRSRVMSRLGWRYWSWCTHDCMSANSRPARQPTRPRSTEQRPTSTLACRSSAQQMDALKSSTSSSAAAKESTQSSQHLRMMCHRLTSPMVVCKASCAPASRRRWRLEPTCRRSAGAFTMRTPGQTRHRSGRPFMDAAPLSIQALPRNDDPPVGTHRDTDCAARERNRAVCGWEAEGVDLTRLSSSSSSDSSSYSLSERSSSRLVGSTAPQRGRSAVHITVCSESSVLIAASMPHSAIPAASGSSSSAVSDPSSALPSSSSDSPLTAPPSSAASASAWLPLPRSPASPPPAQHATAGRRRGGVRMGQAASVERVTTVPCLGRIGRTRRCCRSQRFGRRRRHASATSPGACTLLLNCRRCMHAISNKTTRTENCKTGAPKGAARCSGQMN